VIEQRRLYLVAPARLPAGRLADLVGELASAGVDLVQLREKELEAGDLLRAGEPVRSACAQAGVPFIVNDRPDVALALGADGVHLGQKDLPVAVARRILGGAIVGRSTHAPAEIDGASQDAPDYIAVGPVYETPTKPGRPAVGLGLLRYAAAHAGRPWFAIGGIDRANLADVLAAGARRIVVVRAVTQAPSPPEAAAALREMLDALPL
jgi:thiamine-phosphate pyrophosphorylase